MRITTEHIYFGGYAIVIGVSLLTIYFAKKAAKTGDLEEAKRRLEEHQQEKPESDNGQETLEGSQEDE